MLNDVREFVEQLVARRLSLYRLGEIFQPMAGRAAESDVEIRYRRSKSALARHRLKPAGLSVQAINHSDFGA